MVALAVIEAGRIGVGYARGEQRQGDRVAADERRIVDWSGGDHGAHLGGIGLEQSGLAFDLDTFGQSADLQCDIDTCALVDFQREIGVEVGLEAFGFHGQRVSAVGNARKGVNSILVGRGGPLGAPVQVLSLDRSTYDGGTGSIGDSSGNSGAGFLPEDRDPGQNEDQKQK